MTSVPFPPVDEHLEVENNLIKSPAHSKFLHLLPKDRINLLVPAGVGDLYWILAKFQTMPGTIFWIPDAEQRRCRGLAEMCGIEYGYLPGLTTDYVWSRPGMPAIDGPGIYEIQPNRHLESGRPLEEWYQGLPVKYPKLNPRHHLIDAGDHVFVFMCNENYMSGQLCPETWASMLRVIEDRHGTIVLCGAARDVDFATKVNTLMGGTCKTLFNCPLNEVMAWILSAKLCIGVAAGLLILAVCHNVPTVMAYPRHLASMPGTWEPRGGPWRWCFVDSLQRNIFKQIDTDIL